jgi:hypothetical protein
MAYRATPQDSTHVSPNLAMFGREVNLSVDLVYGNPNNEIVDPVDYISELRQNLEYIHDFTSVKAHVGKRNSMM